MKLSRDELRELEPTPFEFDEEFPIKGDRLAELVQMALRSIELDELVNTPNTADFLEAVKLEAAHQIERFGCAHDAGKTPLDWFWLVGYLAQKAADAAASKSVPRAVLEELVAKWRAAASDADANPSVLWRDAVYGRANDLELALNTARALDLDKAKHHTISTAAALLNWHRALCGAPTPMRPGIEPPDDT